MQITVLIILLHATLLQIGKTTSYTSPSKNRSFTLGDNLIVNPNISTPVISPNIYYSQAGSMGGWSTKVLSVEIIDAVPLSAANGRYGIICASYSGVSSGSQFLDLDSTNKNEQYYQRFTLTAGRQFQLTFDWISQIKTASSCGISVIWNGVIITTFYDASCKLKNSSFYFISADGVNEIVFQGIGTVDSYGIMIRNVVLKEVIYIYNRYDFWNASKALGNNQLSTLFTTFDNAHQNQLTYFVSTFSALKQNIKFLLGLLLQINHFVLYNYHQINNTLLSTVALAGVKALDDKRGNILNNYFYPLLGTSSEKIVARFELNNSLPVLMSRLVQIYITHPSSALLQIFNIFLVDAPITILFFLVGAFLFRMCFKYKLFVLFKQYSVPIFLIYLILDGRIQILTFHVLSRILLLANISFIQKIVTVFVICLYFLVFFSALALMALYRSSIYKELIKYVNQNCRYASTGTFYMTLHFGIYNITLGFVHRLLLIYPFLQLCMLITIQILCLGYLIFFFIRGRFANVILGVILCLLNCNRLLFTISLLLFQIFPALGNTIGTIQMYIFFSFLGLLALSSLAGLITKVLAIVKLLKSSEFGYPKATNQNMENEQIKQPNFEQDKINSNQLPVKNTVPSEITSVKEFIQAKDLKEKKGTQKIFDKQTRSKKLSKGTKIKFNARGRSNK